MGRVDMSVVTRALVVVSHVTNELDAAVREPFPGWVPPNKPDDEPRVHQFKRLSAPLSGAWEFGPAVYVGEFNFCDIEGMERRFRDLPWDPWGDLGGVLAWEQNGYEAVGRVVVGSEEYAPW
jgi:hypothetical protein